jgi:hypothetical protein
MLLELLVKGTRAPKSDCSAYHRTQCRVATSESTPTTSAPSRQQPNDDVIHFAGNSYSLPEVSLPLWSPERVLCTADPCRHGPVCCTRTFLKHLLQNMRAVDGDFEDFHTFKLFVHTFACVLLSRACLSCVSCNRLWSRASRPLVSKLPCWAHSTTCATRVTSHRKNDLTRTCIHAV